MKIRLTLNTVLYAVLFAVLIVIATGTIAVFATRKAQPGTNLRHSDPAPQAVSDNLETYSELGQIRTVTAFDKDWAQATIILKPWFSYESESSAFREELAGKRRRIRSLIADYFQSRTYNQLIDCGEGLVKTELLALINGELSMGKLSAVYFEEYLFLEY